jgi:hypothetical protein
MIATARRSPLRVAALGLGLALLLAACTRPGAPEPRPPATTAAPTPTSQTPSEDGTLKPVGAGLYYTGEPQPGFESIDHTVIGGPWADFEPRPGDFSGPGWERVEAALRDLPDHKFRLRIMAGREAPDWAGQLGGPCVPVQAPSSQIPACVPRFWTDAFLDAYERLMDEVARRYDREPRILDVVNSACTTTWAEPFIRTGRNRAANLALWDAGLNQASDRRCFDRSMEIMDRAFQSTRISLATHQVWQVVVGPDGAPSGMRPSWPEERSLLNELRSRYGGKMVVQNNGLGGNEGCRGGESLARASSMWCWLASLPPPKGFQTEGNRKLEARGFVVADAIRQAIDMRGCFVEHNEFGDDPAAATELDRQLKANCPGAS